MGALVVARVTHGAWVSVNTPPDGSHQKERKEPARAGDKTADHMNAAPEVSVLGVNSEASSERVRPPCLAHSGVSSNGRALVSQASYTSSNLVISTTRRATGVFPGCGNWQPTGP